MELGIDYDNLPIGSNVYGVLRPPLRTGLWRALKPVKDDSRCTKCGICWMYCPEHTIRKTEEGDYVIDYEYCKGCGVCATECPSEAIQMVEEAT